MGALSVLTRSIDMFEKFNKARPSFTPRYKDLPITCWEYSQETLKHFNEIYRYIYDDKWPKFQRTAKGAIRHTTFVYCSYDVIVSNNSVELTICSLEGFFRLQLSFLKYVRKKDGTKITGSQAWREFSFFCKREGIDLEAMKITNGAEIKDKEIEKALIGLKDPLYQDLIWENVHHLDIHSAWPAALTRMRPEFLKPIQQIYDLKEIYKLKNPLSDNIYKAILNSALGYGQSLKAYHNAAWAHLAKDAINENNRYMRELTKKLEDSGRLVISYNTDGIWYQGDLYHDEDEGPKLGQWENDHINCKLRYKSNGCYEYIEDGVYHPVMRGHTKREDTIPRDQWVWGDIYLTYEITFVFIEGVGVIEKEVIEDGLFHII